MPSHDDFDGEPGIRLIRQDEIETFDTKMQTLKQDLDEAVEQLDRHYEQLKSAARNRLGSLYNPADYPFSLRGLFSVTHDFPSVEPPQYLAELSPDLYQQECDRVAARFDEAVQMAEQAFLEELQDLVTHLTERLTGQPNALRHGTIRPVSEYPPLPSVVGSLLRVI